MRQRGDPYWINTRYAGTCVKCGKPIAKGESAFYVPRGRTMYCKPCGDEASAQFQSEVWDEEHNTCL